MNRLLVTLLLSLLSLGLISQAAPVAAMPTAQAVEGDYVCTTNIISHDGPLSWIFFRRNHTFTHNGEYLVYLTDGNVYSARVDGSRTTIELTGPLVTPGTSDNERITGNDRWVLFDAVASDTQLEEQFIALVDGSQPAVPIEPRTGWFSILDNSDRMVYRDSNGYLYLKDLYSTNPPILLAESVGADYSYFVVHDSPTHLFLSAGPSLTERWLYMVPLDGSSAPTQLGTLGRSRKVSDDGQYLSFANRDNYLFTVPTDNSSSPIQISTEPLIDEWDAWQEIPGTGHLTYRTENGTAIAPIDGSIAPTIIQDNLADEWHDVYLHTVTSDVIVINTYSPLSNELSSDGEIFVVDWRNGIGPVQISTTTGDLPIEEIPIYPPPLSNASYQITADGKYLTYFLRLDAGNSYYWSLYSVPLDRSRPPTVLTPRDPNAGLSTVDVEISADGQYLFYKPRFYVEQIPHIYLTRIDGTTPPIEFVEGTEILSITPDSQGLIYRSGDEDAAQAVNIIPIDGGVPTQITLPFDNQVSVENRNISVLGRGAGYVSIDYNLRNPDYIVYVANYDGIDRLYSARCEAVGPRTVYPATNLTVLEVSSTPAALTLDWTHNDADATLQNVAATTYRAQLRDGAQVLYETIFDTEAVCTGTACSAALGPWLWTENKAYTVHLSAERGDDIASHISVQMNVDIPAASAMAFTAPTDTDTSRPTVTWDATGSNASYFRLFVGPSDDLGNPAFFDWLARAEVCSDNGVGDDCAFTLPVDLMDDTEYQAWMHSAGPGGLAEQWVGPGLFTLDIPLPELVQNITVDPRNGRPEVTWDADANTLWYHIYMGGNGVAYDEWHEAATICDAGTCTLRPTINWPGGTYAIWMQAWGPAGFSSPDGANTTASWVQGPDLNLPTTPPAIPTGLTVTGTDQPNITYQWDAMEDAIWYEIVLEPGNWNYSNWMDAEVIVCGDSGTCSWSDAQLAGGVLDINAGVDSYTVTIRAWGPGGLTEYAENVTLEYTYSGS